MCELRTGGVVFVKNKRKRNLRHYRKTVRYVDKRVAMFEDRYFSFLTSSGLRLYCLFVIFHECLNLPSPQKKIKYTLLPKYNSPKNLENYQILNVIGRTAIFAACIGRIDRDERNMRISPQHSSRRSYTILLLSDRACVKNRFSSVYFVVCGVLRRRYDIIM